MNRINRYILWFAGLVGTLLVMGAELASPQPSEESVRIPMGAKLGPMGDNLVRVFHFSNRSKSGYFWDPRPEVAGYSSPAEPVRFQVQMAG